MSKTKILQWVIALLIVLNVSTVLSIIFHNRYDRNKEESTSIVLEKKGKRLTGKYLREELGFDNAQMETFRKLNHPFRENTRNIIIQLDSLKEEMFVELKKEHADTNKLHKISQKIGEQHFILKKNTAQFYLAIKSICTTEQSEKLQDIFSPLFDNKTYNKALGKRKKKKNV